MRSSLAESLAHVYSAFGAKLNTSASDVDTMIANIQTHRVRPGVFGRYYKLVFAIQNGKLDQAQELFRQLISSVEHEPSFSVAPFTDAALGPERQLYGDLIDPDPGDTPWILSPPSDSGPGDLVYQALKLIDVVDQDLARELRVLIIQLVGASAYYGPNSRQFGSVSSLMLWGLVMANHKLFRTPSRMLQVLVHEGAHLLLFAHSIDEPLVTNPIDARYLSPLRPDPRPMDGVFHATFVLARLHYLARKLREATTADFAPEPIDELDERLVRLRERYFGGFETIRQHGELTKTGQRILDESLEYMKSA